jgi:hypothetical protein
MGLCGVLKSFAVCFRNTLGFIPLFTITCAVFLTDVASGIWYLIGIMINYRTCSPINFLCYCFSGAVLVWDINCGFICINVCPNLHRTLWRRPLKIEPEKVKEVHAAPEMNVVMRYDKKLDQKKAGQYVYDEVELDNLMASYIQNFSLEAAPPKLKKHHGKTKPQRKHHSKQTLPPLEV